MRSIRVGFSLAIAGAVVAGALALATGEPSALAAERELAAASVDDAFVELFEISKQEKKGVIVYVEGQAIPGIVSSIGEASIEMRNQEFSRVVVRLDEVVAVAIY